MTTFSKFLFAITAFSALGLSVSPALAEKADRDKPLNAQADALKYDDLKQTSVFTGNVIITKGTIVMRGARIDVRQDPEGYQFATMASEPGKLAFFRQKRENGVDEYIEGEAITIEYDGKADKVRLIKNSVLKRLHGAVLNDEITGNLIVYDNTTDVYTVDGGIGNNAGGNSGGRVRAILSPKPGTSAAPASTIPSAAPASNAAPKVTLRPATSIGGGGK
ncbi:MAG: lipopolysaccharide transport periplasmic protein LptA [Burkholderiaceae bacterium]|nr:lipopolysaccharide transport periplasmic protein LptA [Burkholderiaceae bacterium]